MYDDNYVFNIVEIKLKKKKKKLQFSLSFPGVGTFSDMCACTLLYIQYIVYIFIAVFIY